MLPGMRVLVTGGHGFVGGHLVDRLLQAGDEVRCLYRHAGTPAFLADRAVEIARGDARDPEAVASALEGMDEVHHLAALTRSRTRREMLATNLGATRVLLGQAARLGLAGRFVFCSSLAAAGPSPDGHALREDDPCRPVTWYGESKALAEDEVRRWSNALHTTIVRPPAVYGPRDRDFLAVFQAARRGLAPLLGDGPKTYSFIYVVDLAQALFEAARHPDTAGHTFYATHPDPVPIERFLSHVAEAVGRSTRRIRLPDALLRLAASLGELSGQLSGSVPLLNRQRILELEASAYVCSGERLSRATGWRARTDTRVGSRETATWYCEKGWIR
jgi:nucleoside-diphosphate-sugar epimerase